MYVACKDSVQYFVLQTEVYITDDRVVCMLIRMGWMI